ncbi:hypothetical protein [Blastococcus tunisiensis]|uniref:ARB-07466-like C-terminal domain-containing protein n=1 Tax=Blastococcus tunisiensis TaxID=1798228 RepID=A0A1I2IUG9_9ACTN|nr:hypothetical protein [Blastococcus sp. DSM 46838]SFF45934.1 hypothetical protein SAMN05216574_11440 [Blastococcus sp. DSM 46838]
MAPLTPNTAQPTDDTPGSEQDVVRRPRRAGRRLTTAPRSRVAYSLGIATVCALAAIDLVSAEPAANAEPESTSVVVAAALGIDGSGVEPAEPEDSELLGQLAASRSERDAEQAAAAASQAQAEQEAAAAQAAEEARIAAEAAAAAQAAEAAAAAQAAAEAAAAAPAPAAAAAATTAGVVARISNSSGPIKGVAQAAANAVVSNVPGAAGITIGGTRASAADPGGHPSGLALDYMCSPALGDAIAQYHIAHWNELGVEYVIWQQRMLSSPGGSWKAMENRGSATANHMDHVHVNYRG